MMLKIRRVQSEAKARSSDKWAAMFQMHDDDKFLLVKMLEETD
jgi:hypothetical protein